MPPAQGWQGQQPTWQQGQQPQPGWGPGYGQPQQGWAPQAGWAPQQPQYGSSALVSLAGVVLILFGIAVAILGGLTLTQGPEIGRFIRDNDVAVFGRQIDRETLRTILSPMPGVLIVIGLLQLVVGAVILSHRGWARWLGVLLSLLGLIIGIVALSGVMALAPGASVPLMISAVLLVGYAFVLLALIAGGSHFRKNYPGR
jgi:hypothetical protein